MQNLIFGFAGRFYFAMKSENVRLKITKIDGSIKYGETLEEQIERLNCKIVERVEVLENNISKPLEPLGGFALAFRERLIDEELQRFYFNELIPEVGKVRFID